jgi:hypothetical protein
MKRVLATLLNEGLVAQAPHFCGNRPEMVYSLTATYRESLRAQLDGMNEAAEKVNET